MATSLTGTLKINQSAKIDGTGYLYEEEAAWIDDAVVSTPTNDTDIANKKYVDDQILTKDTATEIAVTATGFDGNLTTSDNTVQKVAQKFDDYNPLPAQTNNGGKYLGTSGTAASWSYPTKLVRFLEPTLTTAPNVAGGEQAVSFEFSVPAAGWAEFEYVTITNAIFKYFTADGVATETRKIIYDDQDGSPVTSQIAAGLAMPNNANTYYMPCQSYIIRIGTHLYFKDEPVFTNISLTGASTSGFAVGDMVDLGEPDFTKTIDIQFAHLLSAASANAIIQCLGVQVTLHKLS